MLLIFSLNQTVQLKGTDGNTRLCDLYSKARKTYSKGYATREMIKTLDLSKIRSKRLAVLKELEVALDVKQKTIDAWDECFDDIVG